MSEIQHPAGKNEMSDERLAECRVLESQMWSGGLYRREKAAMRDLLNYVDYLRGELALADGREQVLIELMDNHDELLKHIVDTFDRDQDGEIYKYLDEARELTTGMGNDPRAYVKAVKHE